MSTVGFNSAAGVPSAGAGDTAAKRLSANEEKLQQVYKKTFKELEDGHTTAFLGAIIFEGLIITATVISFSAAGISLGGIVFATTTAGLVISAASLIACTVIGIFATIASIAGGIEVANIYRISIREERLHRINSLESQFAELKKIVPKFTELTKITEKLPQLAKLITDKNASEIIDKTVSIYNKALKMLELLDENRNTKEFKKSQDSLNESLSQLEKIRENGDEKKEQLAKAKKLIIPLLGDLKLLEDRIQQIKITQKAEYFDLLNQAHTK